MGRKIPYTQINVPVEVKEKIVHMAKILKGKKISKLVEEVFNQLYDQCSEFKECVMVSDGHSNKVVFAFAGKSMLIKGSFSGLTEESEESVNEKVRKRIGEDFEERDKNE